MHTVTVTIPPGVPIGVEAPPEVKVIIQELEPQTPTGWTPDDQWLEDILLEK